MFQNIVVVLFIAFFSAHAFGEFLQPLNEQASWTYKVKSSYHGCHNGSQKREIVQKEIVSGKSAFKMIGPCRGFGHYYLSLEEAGRVDSLYQGSWWRFLDTPVEEGHKWQEFRAEAQWQEIGDVSVTAGEFTNCWRKVRSVRYTHWEDYCYGVGMVRSKIVDLRGGYILMELESFDL